MLSAREMERNIYTCEEVDCLNYDEFPLADEEEFIVMEDDFLHDEERVHIDIYLSRNTAGRDYVDVYVWDCMLYPKAYKRFVICAGMRLGDNDEKEFLYYVGEAAQDGVADVTLAVARGLNFSFDEAYDLWHCCRYEKNRVSEMLSHLYYANHRSGVREILYKAGLPHIAYNIDCVYEYNMIGSSPTAIIGCNMPIKLLRILDQPSLIHNLYSADTAENCCRVYDMYSDYIGEEKASAAQWEYLSVLYAGGGYMKGRAFNRTIYNNLAHEQNTETVRDYERFFELTDSIGFPIDVDIPKVSELSSRLDRLAVVHEYETPAKNCINALIEERAKDTYYEFSDELFTLLLPKNGMDMCTEAMCQGNCLLDYIDKHAKGITTIVFLRESTALASPYVTVEVCNNEIKQVYAKHNAKPRREVYMFLNEYAYRKGFGFDPEELQRG